MGNSKHANPPGGPQDKADIEAALERVSRRIRELRTFDASGIQDRWDGRLEQLQKNVNKAIGEAVGMGSPQYRQYAIGPLDAALDSTFGDRYTADELREEVRKAVAQAAVRLTAVGRLLQQRLGLEAGDSSPTPLADARLSNFGTLSNFGSLPSGSAPLTSGPAPLAAETAAPARPAATPTPARTVAPAPPATVAPAPVPSRTPLSRAVPAPTPEPAPESESAPTREPAPAPKAAPAPARTPSPSTAAPLQAPVPVANPSSMNTPVSTAHLSRIAIVCRDDQAGEAVTTFVAQLGLEPVITQQPRADFSSLDSLEALRQTAFAIVLQANRQLEIGFLLGALGRARVCVLQAGRGEDSLPGLAHQALDEGGMWKLLLAREMKRCGLDVDMNKAF